VLEVFRVPWQQLLDLIRDGTITDVKTIVGTYWLERVLKQSEVGQCGASVGGQFHRNSGHSQ